jgi:hypothetical protein
MQRLELKPTHKPVQNYYAALRQFDDLGVTHETAVRSAFQERVPELAGQNGWLAGKDPFVSYCREHAVHKLPT